MLKFKKGIAPVVIVLIVALGLAAGATAGYTFREQIKKAVKGKTTQDEINDAVNAEKLGQSKFELEGVTTEVDAGTKVINVKIKSSTDSIKELRLSDAPIAVSDTADITFGSTKDLKIADIPINAQVHVGGTIKDGALTATKVIIQKEDADENGKAEKDRFAVGGIVKEVGSNKLVVTVATANKLAKDQKGKDLTIKVDSSTTIEKGDSAITLSDIKADDNVQVTGTIVSSEYIASKIEVKVQEKAGELEATENQGSTNSNAGGNSNSNSNKAKNQ